MVNHLFHVLKLSSYPTIVRFIIFFAFRSILMFFKYFIYQSLIFSILILFLVILQWLGDIKREGMLGYHSLVVRDNLKLGFVVFICTEIILFFRFFWAFFDRSLSNTLVDTGMVWTPYFISPLNPFDLPLINTLLLLFRRVLLTYAHMRFYENEKIFYLLFWTLVLGVMFMYLQYLEYTGRRFTLGDRVYGSLFFRITGLHGIHVIVGGVFIMFFMWYYWKNTYRTSHSLWIDLASLYWHFVDVVWFFVWGFIYIWRF